jgi:hypothetical protein
MDSQLPNHLIIMVSMYNKYCKKTEEETFEMVYSLGFLICNLCCLIFTVLKHLTTFGFITTITNITRFNIRANFRASFDMITQYFLVIIRMSLMFSNIFSMTDSLSLSWVLVL